MKERPIIFNADMVRAILEGRKTQTRRPIQPQPASGVRPSPFVGSGIEDGHGYEIQARYGQPGDRLWVREALVDEQPGTGRIAEVREQWAQPWARECSLKEFLDANEWRYAADEPPAWEWERVIPSIHMPRFASRITLEIVEMRVHRLQEISILDVEAEGTPANPMKKKSYRNDNFQRLQDFRWLWDGVYFKLGLGWGVNPWVWAITFRRLEQTHGCPQTPNSANCGISDGAA
jgi:hypothetical protein